MSGRCETCAFWEPQTNNRIWQVPKEKVWGLCSGLGDDQPSGGGLAYIRSDDASAGPDLITHQSFVCSHYCLSTK